MARQRKPQTHSLAQRMSHFLTPVDARFEDLRTASGR